MEKIILDTNFLLVPMQFKVDIFSEMERICHFNYKIYVYEQTINELKEIANKQSGKDKKAALLALKLISLKSITIIKNSKDRIVDDIILENLDKNMIVATLDKDLKTKLLEKKAAVIFLRQKKYLEIFGRKLYK